MLNIIIIWQQLSPASCPLHGGRRSKNLLLLIIAVIVTVLTIGQLTRCCRLLARDLDRPVNTIQNTKVQLFSFSVTRSLQNKRRH